jgi:type I restriction enzyme M protein
MRYTPDSNDALGTGLPVPITIEAAGVTLALARGKKIALCVMPPSFLFRAAKADQIFKERAIRDYGLDSIIGLPRGKLGNTLIPVSVLVFKPDKLADTPLSDGSSVFIVDAREAWESDGVYLEDPFPVAELIRNHEVTEISVNVTVDDLAANGFNLSVERYVLDANALRLRELAANTLTVQLEDIVELYRPQAMPGAKTSTTATETVFAEVGVADIDEVGLVRTASKQLTVGPDAELQGRKARLQPGDVLLVIKGSVGKVGFVRDIPGDAIWLASQSFTRLRLREHSLLKDPRVLFRFLSSDLGQANLQALRVGSAVPGLQMADVRRLSIVVPDNERQHEIARDVDGLFALQDEIQKLKSDLADRQHQIWPQTNNADHASGGKPRTKTTS